MGRVSRPHTASDEDEDCSQAHRKLRVLGLLVSRGKDLSSTREPCEAQGETRQIDVTHSAWFDRGDLHGIELGSPRLVLLLSPLSLDHLRGSGLEDTQSPTAIAAPTASEQPDTFPTSRTLAK